MHDPRKRRRKIIYLKSLFSLDPLPVHTACICFGGTAIQVDKFGEQVKIHR